MTSFEGKVALVTGSANGLGKGVALAFLEAGAKVVLCDINEGRLKEAEAELSGKGAVFAHKVDTTDEASVEALMSAAVDAFGKIDVLVNNAGIMDTFTPVGEQDKAQWDRVMAVNVTGTMLVTKHFIRHVLGQTAAAAAAIVNVGSLASFKGWVAGAAYTASKHALVGLTKSTAAFYGAKGVRCNLIQPPGMPTGISEGLPPFHEEGIRTSRDLNPKVTSPESVVMLPDVAKLVLYLSSDQASLVNGQCISPDRGLISAS
ncbi:uncharacterized protein PV09_03025 [Verruconis gallopava]|uniref:Uncharacterized protein n=1 Tax=Verruconis gallopava TaxID=253628 RepID=A0A0D2B3G4_9PEZI|nr:uncharacterized protein PV09_03025 [Verruconis gallopava]KIW05819.1 hypothetical protein PV09_03025 [Verruconis gallopava]